MELCSFCDTEWGVTSETDVKGNAFNICGGCWARVIHAIIPDDVIPIIERERRFNAIIIKRRAEQREGQINAE